MSIFDSFRRGVDEPEAIHEISWLSEHGFWGLVGKKIDSVLNSIQKQLNSEGNTRDTDMFLKGQLRGIQRSMLAIEEIRKHLQETNAGE